MFKKLIFFLVFYIPHLLHSQSPIYESSYLINQVYDSMIDDHEYYIVKSNHQTQEYQVFSADEKKKNTQDYRSVIVEFNGKPMTLHTNNTSIARYSYEKTFQNFENDLRTLMSPSNVRIHSVTSSIDKKYFKTFYGVSVEVPYQLMEKIEQLPYVKKVYPDRKVKALLDGSANQVRAVEFREKYDTQGEGVVVGIIDTGIDYIHQDLGGGLGDGYKVIGGYDFVNDDNDPMDDNGHGTHVAGIVAANGQTLQGIAPKALLVGLKVLDSYGYGNQSDIIAAIEWCMDPNGDGDFSDKLDVVNMSLGGEGDANDPLSQAVDNAVRAGITVCVAAGNDQYNYKISSPGTARQAITVGASDDDDDIAYFSSKGPTHRYFLIKPDIVAPGDMIYSSKPDNSYASESGTSMSTPHVAGAVALLKSIYPHWTPQQIKSALMQGATDIGGSIWEQGAGRLDIVEAAAQRMLVTPASVSFGWVDNATEIWTKTDTLTLYNISGDEKHFSLSVAGSSTPGLNFSFSETELVVPPQGSSQVLFSVIVDNQQLAYKTENPPSYEGKILVNDGNQGVSVPFALIKSPVLELHFDARPDLVIIHNRQEEIFKQSNTDTLLLQQLPQGVYDVMVFFDGFTKLIVRENVTLSDLTQMYISKREAMHELVFKGISPSGEELPVMDDGFESLLYKSTNKNIGLRLLRITAYIGMPPKSAKRYVSDISDNYSYELGLSSSPSMNTGKYWLDFPFSFDEGIDISNTYQNSPQDFEKVIFNYKNQEEHVDSLFFTLGRISMGRGSSYYIYDQNMIEANVLKPPYRREGYFLRNPTQNFVISSIKYEDIFKLDSAVFRKEKDIMVSTTGRMELHYGTNVTRFSSNWRNVLTLKNTEPYAEVTWGLSPPQWNANIYRESNAIRLYKENIYFTHPFGDIHRDSIQYKITSAGELLSEGWILNTPQPNYEEENNIIIPVFSNQPLELTTTYDHFNVNKRQGIATVKYNFAAQELGNVPGITTLNFSQQDTPGEVFSTALPISLAYLPGNYMGKYWTVSIKHAELDTVWTEIPMTYNNLYYRYYGQIQPDTLVTGYYSLKVTAHDGNFEYTVAPAFYLAPPKYLDSLALVALYQSTQGGKWLNHQGWLADQDIANWHGVTVENGRVTAIRLPANNLQGYVPREVARMTNLQVLDLSANHLTDLVDLSGITSLEHLNVGGNKLTFEDLEPNISIPDIQYTPQDSLGKSKTSHFNTGNALELTAYAGGNFNQYTWYKDGELLDIANDTLQIDTLTLSDGGTYHYKVTSDTVSGLALFSYPIEVHVSEDPFQKISDQIITRDDGNSQGVNWVDYDNDGDTDLFVVDYEGKHSLYQNKLEDNDTLSFQKMNFSNGLNGLSYASTSTWADYDNDGFWDVFVTSTNPKQPSQLYHNQGDHTFVQVNDTGYHTKQWSTQSASWGDYNNDGFADLLVGNAWHYEGSDSRDFIVENEEGKNFTPFLLSFHQDGTVNCGWVDYDNDGDLDIYSASTNNRLMMNVQDTLFNYYGISYESASISGGNWGDYDNDGDLDLFVTNTTPWCVGCEGRNQLYRNDTTNFTLIEESAFAQIENNSQGSAWGDYDNDGDLDIFVSNWGENNEIWKNILMESGAPQFEVVKSIATSEAGQSMGAAWADYDNDGDLDLFVANWSQDNFLYQNKGNENHWLGVTCVGGFSNRAAIGTRIQVKAQIKGKAVWQMREVSAQTGRSSQNSATQLIGLGDASQVDTLIVQWPSGLKQYFNRVGTDQHLILIEPSLFLFKPNDASMFEGQVLTIPLDVRYKGENALTLSASSENTSLTFSFSGQVLKIKAGDWTGQANVSVRIEDGEFSDEKEFLLTIHSFTQENPEVPGEEPEDPGTVTGIENEDPDNVPPVVIYPNPNKGAFYVQINHKNIRDIQISVLDQLGKIIYEKAVTERSQGNSVELTLNDLPSGMYTVHVQTGDTIYSKKVFIYK